jgi:hypothetical protein
VIGAQGTISGQVDLVLCDLQNFPAFGYGRGALFLPDSVFGVISVKTVLLPHELPTFFREAAAFKALLSDAMGAPWPGFYAVLGYWLDGSAKSLTDRYHAGVFGLSAKRTGVDLVAAIDRGPICLDLATFGVVGEPPRFLAGRSFVPGIAFDACTVDSDEPFVDIYKLLVTALDSPRLSRIVELAAPPAGEVLPDGVSTDPAYRATFVGKSADLFLVPGATGNFQIFYANTGTAPWVRGEASEARLIVAGPRDYRVPSDWGSGWLSDDVYAAQLQPRVDPGSLAGFGFNVTAPSDARPGHYRFYGRPAIAGVGALTGETRASSVELVPDLPAPGAPA